METTLGKLFLVIIIVATIHPTAVDVLAREITRSDGVNQPEIYVYLMCSHVCLLF
jgi:hypothetical protein